MSDSPIDPAAIAPNTIHSNLDFETYLAAPGVSQSSLKQLRPTPAHFIAARDAERQSTPSQQLGTLVHHAILEPDKPYPDIAVKPHAMKFTTRDGKAWKAEQDAAGREIITAAAHKDLHGMVSNAAAHPVVREIFSNPDVNRELSCFAAHQTHHGEVVRKARLDLIPAGNALLDIKTTRDASDRNFSRDFFNFGYHIQSPYYLDIWNTLCPDDQRTCFVFIVIESVPPYSVRLFNLDAEAIEYGRQEYRALLDLYAECRSNNHWPGYPTDIETLHLPAWMS